jgi:hypothetical protein
MNGFTDDQIIELRRRSKLGKTNVLAQTAKRIASTSGQIGADSLSAFMLRVTLKKTWLT